MRGQHLKPKQTDASTKHATLLKQKVVSRTGLSQSRTPNLYCNPRNPMLHTQTSKSYILATLNPKSIPDMLRSFAASSAYAAESSSCLGISGLGAIDVYQVHSFIHSFIHWIIHALQSFTHSFISFHLISFIHAFLPSFIRSFIKTYVHVCVFVCNYSFLYLSCICHLSMLHVHINTYITHTYVRTYIHTHTYIHEYIHTDMHTHTYICTYIYIVYIHT